jgi:hypothetical protein
MEMEEKRERKLCLKMWEEKKKVARCLKILPKIRAGHGSVQAGFGLFGHPTRDHWVWIFSTPNNQ